MKSKITKFTCNRCGYSWIPRSEDPKVCAHCRSPYWNLPRKNKTKEEDKAKTNTEKSLNVIDQIKKNLS